MRLFRRIAVRYLRLFHPKKANGFYGLGINNKLADSLDERGFVRPTPIQNKAIPVALQGKDIIGVASTGTGKTLAFLLPIIQGFADKKTRKAVILLPTRELAVQLAEVCELFAGVYDVHYACLIGGEKKDKQLRDLRHKAKIIIGTPGRVNDFIERGNLRLRDVNVLVLDEADRMFDMGFAPQIHRIIRNLPAKRQTMLFSATMPEEVLKLSAKYMKEPVQININNNTTAPKIKQELYVVRSTYKPMLILKLLEVLDGTVLIFVETRYDAAKVAQIIKHAGHNVAEIHSDRTMEQRRDALEGFKSGKYRILVATDIAARGIDVTGIEAVVNYTIPQEDGSYIHRIGRTGRAGHDGLSITFAQPEQGGDIKSIEELTGVKMEQKTIEGVPSEKIWGYERAASGRGWNSQA